MDATTAEQLMRSRYSAFAMGDATYLRHSWHPATRPAVVTVDPQRQWTGLEILATTGGGPGDQEGTVEFRAEHRRGTEIGTLHELSLFRRFESRWVYVGPVEWSAR